MSENIFATLAKGAKKKEDASSGASGSSNDTLNFLQENIVPEQSDDSAWTVQSKRKLTPQYTISKTDLGVDSKKNSSAASTSTNSNNSNSNVVPGSSTSANTNEVKKKVIRFTKDEIVKLRVKTKVLASLANIPDIISIEPLEPASLVPFDIDDFNAKWNANQNRDFRSGGRGRGRENGDENKDVQFSKSENELWDVTNSNDKNKHSSTSGFDLSDFAAAALKFQDETKEFCLKSDYDLNGNNGESYNATKKREDDELERLLKEQAKYDEKLKEIEEDNEIPDWAMDESTPIANEDKRESQTKTKSEVKSNLLLETLNVKTEKVEIKESKLIVEANKNKEILPDDIFSFQFQDISSSTPENAFASSSSLLNKSNSNDLENSYLSNVDLSDVLGKLLPPTPTSQQNQSSSINFNNNNNNNNNGNSLNQFNSLSSIVPAQALPALTDDWEYLDPQNAIQGPFTSKNMRRWLESGYFKTDLPIRLNVWSKFYPLGLIFPNLESSFLSLCHEPKPNNVHEEQMRQKHLAEMQHQQQLQAQQQAQQLQLIQQQQQLKEMELLRQQQLQLERERHLQQERERQILQERERQVQQERIRQQQQLQAQQAQLQMLQQQQAAQHQQLLLERQQAQQQQQTQQQLQALQQKQQQQQVLLQQQQQIQQQMMLDKQQQAQQQLLLEKQQVLQQQQLLQQQQQAQQEKSKLAQEKKNDDQQTQSTSEKSEKSTGKTWQGVQSNKQAKSLIEIQQEEEKKLQMQQQQHQLQQQQLMQQHLQQQQQQHQQQQDQSLKLKSLLGVSGSVWGSDHNASGAKSLKEIQQEDSQEIARQQSLLLQQQEQMQRRQMSQRGENDVSLANWSKKTSSGAKTLKEIMNEEKNEAEPVKQNFNSWAAKIGTQTSNPPQLNRYPPQPVQQQHQQPQVPQQVQPIIQPVQQATQQVPQQTQKVDDSKARNIPKPTNNKSEFGGKSMSNDFEEFCVTSMQRLNGSGDITLLEFCTTLKSAAEIREYLAAYLGSKPEVSQFATEFINRKESQSRPGTSVTAVNAPTRQINATSGNSTNNAANDKKQKKKKV